MLKKRIGRIKRRTGAVLFAVIAIMSLLIAMASTAYYTARSAYNAVVSNYDYSQLYLSAISVSDMVLEAVTNDPLESATANNEYSVLRESIQGLPKYDPDNEDTTILRASSTNISDASASREAILAELAGSDSTIAGALDGIVLEVKLLNENVVTEDASGNPLKVPADIETKLLNSLKADLLANGIPLSEVSTITTFTPAFIDCKYSITTTAYYRDNVVQVEDIVTMMRYEAYKGAETEKKTTHDGESLSGGFSTFFTATGQELDSDGKIKRATRKVIIDTHEISDDTFFQNTKTYLGGLNADGSANENAGNKLMGGLSTTGSLFLRKASFGADGNGISGDDNDWYIGDDFVLMHDNVTSVKLGSNSLFVGDDMVLAASNNYGVEAEDIYVEGDLYILGSGGTDCTISANLHVNGNIYFEMTGESSIASQVAADGYALQGTKWGGASANTLKIDGTLSVGATSQVVLPVGQTSGVKLQFENANGSTVNKTIAGKISEGAGTTTVTKEDGTADTISNVGTYNKDENVVVVSEVPNYDTNEFDRTETPMTVENAIKKSQNITNYDSYTAPQSAYGNTITLDFNDLFTNSENERGTVDENGNLKVEYYEYEYTYEVDGVTKTVIMTTEGSSNPTDPADCSDIKISLPYDTDGYMLDIKGSAGQADLTYEIETGDEAVPIVLKNNTTDLKNLDDATKGEVPAFSWKGTSGYENTNVNVNVIAKGNGNVVLEMANYLLDGDGAPQTNPDGSYKYAPYDPTKPNDYSSVRYVAGKNEVVGNEAQNNRLTDYTINEDDIAAMLVGSVPKTGYDNQFMLVSNINDGVAFNGRYQLNSFCGYVYAPNGVFDNYNGSGSQPVFGGMIVSTYNTLLAKLYYAEPKPAAIADMLKSLDLWQDGGGGDAVDEEKYETIKANAHGTEAGELNFIGSNYMG